MELMTLLLCCVLVAHLPQAWANSDNINHYKIPEKDTEVKFNSILALNQNVQRKKILLNINAPPLVNILTDLQVVFTDYACKNCITCMERAIKAYNSQAYIVSHRPKNQDLSEEVLSNNNLPRHRAKREVKSTATTPITETKNKKKSKKKQNKTVTVTKYNVDGKIVALKVKETNYQGNETQNEVKSCQVYNIRNTFDCFTPDAESFLGAIKRKKNKKDKGVQKKEKQESETISDSIGLIPPSFKKRHVDNSHVPDNFMPSIEENMY